MCNCFNEQLERVKAHVAKEHPKAVEIGVSWKDRIYCLDGKPRTPVHPRVLIEFQDFKRDDTLKARKTKQEITIMGDYCPFCGENQAQAASHANR